MNKFKVGDQVKYKEIDDTYIFGTIRGEIMAEWQSVGMIFCEEDENWYKTINGEAQVSNYKVGDHVETRCDYNCPSCVFIQGVIVEVSEQNGIPIYKIDWDPQWRFTESEFKLEEEYTGN